MPEWAGRMGDRMKENSSAPDANNDGPLMDFFLAVAAAWKLLVIVPVVTGVLVWAGMHFGKPAGNVQVYRSEATVYSESIGGTAGGVDALMGRQPNPSVPSPASDTASPNATPELEIVPLGEDLYRFVLDQPAPASAQTSLKAALAQAISRLTERDEKRLAAARDVIRALNAGLAREQSFYDLGLRLLSAGAAADSSDEADLVQLWNEVVERADRIEERLESIERAEASLSEYRPTQVVEEPTPDSGLPNPQISSARLGILAALVTGLVLLFIVVIRRRFQRLFQQPATQENLRRILSEL